tara:strand:+ start:435 stop:578 length:144 start_codon:yes stop_codon:yes gene_type:complete
MKYKVVEGRDEEMLIFINKVNALLKKGWKCQGGITNSNGWCQQALIK